MTTARVRRSAGALRATLLLAGLLAASCARPREIDGFHLRVLPARLAGVETELPTVFAEVAASREARIRGLSGRRGLPPNGGMLFVYRDTREREFWMKDCHIALDIAFLDEQGRIVALHDAVPPGAGMPDAEVPRAPSGAPVRFALETAAGWFGEHGLHVGDRAALDGILEGVRPD